MMDLSTQQVVTERLNGKTYTRVRKLASAEKRRTGKPQKDYLDKYTNT